MTVIYLECKMGAAGDMLCAALYELLDAPQRRAFIETMNGLGLPGVEISAQEVCKQGVKGTHYRVEVGGAEEGSDEPQAHGQGSLGDICRLIEGLPLPGAVREHAAAVYRAIACAEGEVHGERPDQVHFHEVGALDAVADIVGCCLLVQMLAPGEIVASPVNTGGGFVRCAHGLLPVPAPATARLLTEIPSYAGVESGELCTPTGAALLAHFAGRFGARPAGCLRAVGYGMGKKDFAALNCVRAMRIETGETGENEAEQVVELRCNLDDMTPEALAFACETLLGQGALDVWCQPITMKKGRAAQMLCCLARAQEAERFAALMLRHTTTLGVRQYAYARTCLTRTVQSLDTPLGAVRVKTAQGMGIARRKPEYEDLARIARERDMTLEQVRAAVEKIL